MDSEKRALGARGMSVEQGRVLVCDRNEWRAIVNVGMFDLALTASVGVSHISGPIS